MDLVCYLIHGKLLWVGAKRILMLGSPIEVEAEAIRWGLRTIASFGYRQMIIETSFLEISKMINGEDAPWPKLKPIIQDISNS